MGITLLLFLRISFRLGIFFQLLLLLYFPPVFLIELDHQFVVFAPRFIAHAGIVSVHTVATFPEIVYNILSLSLHTYLHVVFIRPSVVGLYEIPDRALPHMCRVYIEGKW